MILCFQQQLCMQMEMLGIWIGLIFFFLFSSCYVIDLVSEQEMF